MKSYRSASQQQPDNRTAKAVGMPDWAELLRTAVNVPGTLSSAYSQFHGYSIGNQLLALWQCMGRKIQPGPIATYDGWRGKKRQVQKGQRAITLCMPITGHKRSKDEDGEEIPEVFTYFVYRPNWFVYSQTDGENIEWPAMPEWAKGQALATLGINEVPFSLTDGNTMGYATGKQIAINPMNPDPSKTLVHEIAHIVLGHTQGNQEGEQNQTRSEREMEAESVTLILSEVLGMGNPEHSRGYIQNWYGTGHEIPEKNARRIFAAADKIIKAGRLEGSK